MATMAFSFFREGIHGGGGKMSLGYGVASILFISSIQELVYLNGTRRCQRVSIQSRVVPTQNS